MKNRGPLFRWDPETGVASCVLLDGDNIFIGSATCSPEDRDMMSEKTGKAYCCLHIILHNIEHKLVI